MRRARADSLADAGNVAGDEADGSLALEEGRDFSLPLLPTIGKLREIRLGRRLRRQAGNLRCAVRNDVNSAP